MLFNTNISIIEKQKIYQSYCSSFPEDERRDEKNFWKLFENPNVKIILISNENTPIGYLILWTLSEFIFIEHFEVFKEFRGQNLGSKILKFLSQKYPHLILETEPSELNLIAERRVNFYQRNGYSILNKNYLQPSYGEGKKPLNLWLMGTFTPQNLEKSITEIYKIVYHFQD